MDGEARPTAPPGRRRVRFSPGEEDGDVDGAIGDEKDRDAEHDLEAEGEGVEKAVRLLDDAESADAPTAPSSSSTEAEDGEARSDGDGEDVEVGTADEEGSGSAADAADAVIDPPPSGMELLRDRVLAILDHRLKTVLGLIVLAVIIVDGAFFFFLLIGAQGMCSEPSRTDCEPRNYWYNVSIQVLNGCFTYAATVTLPWRLANFANLWPCRIGRRFCCRCGGPRRECGVGLDLYGRPTDEIWFHIPPRPRRRIIILLLGNALTQYANQASRIIYYSYELADELPGIFWTNVFFLLSMGLAAAGGFIQLREETGLRKSSPDTFPPGPVDLVKKHLPKWWREWRKERKRRRDGRTEKGSTHPTVVEADHIEDGGGGGDGVQGTAGEGGDGEDERDGRTPGHVDRIGRSMPLLYQHSTARIATFWTSFRSWWRNDRPSLGLWGL